MNDAAEGIGRACLVALVCINAPVVLAFTVDPRFAYIPALTLVFVVVYGLAKWAQIIEPEDPRPGYHPRYERNDERLPL